MVVRVVYLFVCTLLIFGKAFAEGDCLPSGSAHTCPGGQFWDGSAGVGYAPPKDSVKYFTDQDSVKYVFIHLIGRDGIDYPVNCSGYYASSLHKSRDTLQTRIDIDSTKVALAGSICVSNINLPNHAPGQEPGIAWYDKEWFERHGCAIIPAHSK